MANLAMKGILGEMLKSKGYETGLIEESKHVYTKVPVFSFQKLKDVDTTLGPEMKSTGEVMGSDENLEKSLYKGLISSGIKVKDQGSVLFTISGTAKEEAYGLAKRFSRLGYHIMATKGTARYFEEKGLRVETVGKIEEEGKYEHDVLGLIYKGLVDMVINTAGKKKTARNDGFKIRRAASEQEIACLTSLDTTDALLKVLESISFNVSSI